jgi:putative selenate reductase molybdopterin-binding subunit
LERLSGPFGAKSVAEISIDGVAPAMASAIYNATDVWMREVPYTPHRVRSALAGKIYTLEVPDEC